jgi:hypothetical protein
VDTTPKRNDTDNVLLRKIALSVSSIDSNVSNLAPAVQPPATMPDAIEIKDANSDNRATVFSTGALKVDNSGIVQPVLVTNPPESQSVTVENFPGVQNVAFPAAQPVTVENFPPGQPVDIASIPPVDIQSLPPVDIASLPSVQISSLPSVDIQSLPGVSVNNFPSNQTVTVNNFPVTQPVSAASLPLPTGAATETTLAALLSKVATNFGKAVNYFPLAQSGTGNTVIAAASPGNRHKVVGFLVTSAANATVQFFSNVTALTGAMDILARGNLQDPVSVLEPTFQTGVGESLNITSTGGAAKGYIVYLTEP